MLNDGEGQFQKRKESDHFSVFRVFEDSEAAIQVDSVMNIVYYMHKDVQKKIRTFGGSQSNGICKIHSKSDQKGEFD